MLGFTPGPHHVATPVGVIWGSADHVTAADDTFLAIVGYSREDLDEGRMNWRGMTPPEFLHLDDAGMRQAESGGFTIPYQKEYIRKDGSRVPVLLVCAFVPGTESDWMGYVVDLTHRAANAAAPPAPTPGTPVQAIPEELHRRLIGSLVNERTSMLAMLDSAPSLIWAVDRDLRLISGNAAFQAAQARVSGRRLDVGDCVIASDFSFELQQLWRQLYVRALSGDRVDHVTADVIGGVLYRLDHTLVPMRDSAGTIYGVTCSSHDVSTRMAAEDALRASESRFRTLASASPLGIALTDAQGKVIYTNERIQALWQLDEEAMLGAGPFSRVHPDDADRVRATWANAVVAGLDVQLEFRLRLPDASERTIRAWLSCLRDENDRITGFVGSIEDATESHALAKRTRQRERLESLGTLAGGIAHDFNNMLGIVLGYTELGLTERVLPATIATDLQEIRTASLRARDLVRQILTFSRHSDGDHTPLDIAALTRESGRLLRATLPAHLQFTVHAPESPVTVMGNASALQQVIVNLCVNAEHALRTTDAPAISLVLTTTRIDGTTSVILRVQDNGHGMPAAVADRIFEPFFTTKPLGEGTGMGLSVVHGTILAHGGTITVDTAPGRGTTFEITIPTCQSAETVEPVTESRVRGSGHVLLVEDEIALAAAVAATLRRAGFKVTACHSGSEALRLISESDVLPDIVVSDVAMPGLTGDKLAKTLEEQYPSLPVVLMTGYSERVTPDGPRGANVIAILQKPVSSAALASVLDHVLT